MLNIDIDDKHVSINIEKYQNILLISPNDKVAKMIQEQINNFPDKHIQIAKDFSDINNVNEYDDVIYIDVK